MSIECAFFGTLARDAESKTSKTGKHYLRFTARVGDGDDACWVSVMTFDDRALELSDKFVKGARVYVEGRLSLNQWTDQAGAQKTGLNVMSFHTHLAAIGKNKSKRSDDSERPRAAASRQREMKLTTPRTADETRDFDDDIPF
jgi:single-strand DNA-binding protein